MKHHMLASQLATTIEAHSRVPRQFGRGEESGIYARNSSPLQFLKLEDGRVSEVRKWKTSSSCFYRGSRFEKFGSMQQDSTAYQSSESTNKNQIRYNSPMKKMQLGLSPKNSLKPERESAVSSLVTRTPTTFDKKASSSKRSLDSSHSQQLTQRDRPTDDLRGLTPYKKKSFKDTSPRQEGLDGNGFIKEIFTGYFNKSQIKKGLSMGRDPRRHLRIGGFGIKGEKILPVTKRHQDERPSSSHNHSHQRPPSAKLDPPFSSENKLAGYSPLAHSTQFTSGKGGSYNIAQFITEQKAISTKSAFQVTPLHPLNDPRKSQKTLVLHSESSEDQILLEDTGPQVEDHDISPPVSPPLKKVSSPPPKKRPPLRLKSTPSSRKISMGRNSSMKRSQASLDLFQLIGSKQELKMPPKVIPLNNLNEKVTAHVKGTTLLRRSPFPNRQSTVFFQYPTCVGFAHPLVNTEPLDQQLGIKLKFKISERSFVYNCVTGPLTYNGFSQTSGSSWNILWSSPLKHESVQQFNKYQHCNHFVNCWTLGRKDSMWRAVSRMKREFPTAYDHICPLTYIFPEDYKRFKLDFEKDPKTMWIMKPAASSCGRGVKVLTKNSNVPRRSGVVVSKYIHSHLLNGFKYDLRVYVLVTSFEPLRIYLFEEGLTRFATQKYTTSKSSAKRRYIHLTNYSVNKHSASFVSNKGKAFDDENQESSSKWSLKALKRKYAEMGINVDKMFKSVKDVIIKAIIAAEPQLGVLPASKNVCFELYGFDILIDQDLRPWLLEVNISPSLSSSSPLDKVIKTALLTDVFNTVGVVPYDRKKFEKQEQEARRKRILGFEEGGTGPSAGKIKPGGSGYNRRDLVIGSGPLRVDELSKEDMGMLIETEEELLRSGKFERIFPLKGNIETYRNLFQHPKISNLLLWKWIQSGKPVVPL